jgi:aspergillopepsin I
MVDAYFREIPGSSFNTNFNTYQFPCNAQLLDFTFGLANGAKATIPSQYMLWGTFDGGNTCVSQMLVGPADGTGQSLWGMTFIQALFVVFDYDGNRVGFANKPLSDA